MADDLSPTQPDTAPPVEDNFSQSEIVSWGKLIPMDSQLPLKVLTEEKYRFGRSPRCEVSFQKEHMENRLYNSISKYHFQITKNMLENNVQVVYLEDLSSNGTYLNGEKVGKNGKVLLENSDEISLAKSTIKGYVYLDNKVVDSWLTQSMRSQYQVLRHLGKGGFGEVKLVIHKSTCQQYAMKKISKERLENDKICNEIRILQRLNHPNVIRLEDIVDTPEAVFISLELMAGGDLKQKLEQQRKLSELEARNVFFQLVKALDYLHNEGITHRDVKAENVLLVNKADLKEVVIKVTDFGLSKVIDSQTELRTRCGTLRYMAPEILHTRGSPNYTNVVDVWSSGVLLFLCLSGHYPFEGDGKTSLAEKIMRGTYCIIAQDWHLISASAINLVEKMLVVCPYKRIRAHDILRHHWLKNYSVPRMAQRSSVIDENDNSTIEVQPCKFQRLD